MVEPTGERGCADLPSMITAAAQAALTTDKGEPIAVAVMALMRDGVIVLSAPDTIERAGLAGRARARKQVAAALLVDTVRYCVHSLDFRPFTTPDAFILWIGVEVRRRFGLQITDAAYNRRSRPHADPHAVLCKAVGWRYPKSLSSGEKVYGARIGSQGVRLDIPAGELRGRGRVPPKRPQYHQAGSHHRPRRMHALLQRGRG